MRMGNEKIVKVIRIIIAVLSALVGAIGGGAAVACGLIAV